MSGEQWQHWTPLSRIKPKEIHKRLSHILDIAAKGTVITRDHAVNILINLAKLKHYSRDAQTRLFSEMASCPANQLPMYAERTATIVTTEMAVRFKEVLQVRLHDEMPVSKRKRIEKVLKKIDEVK